MAFDIAPEQWRKFAQFGGNALSDLGYGLATGTSFGDALGQATMRTQQMQPQRDAWQQMQQEEAQKQETLNRTVEALRERGETSLLQAIETGGITPAEAWGQVLSRQAQGPESGVVINGQLVNPVTGSVIGDYRDEQSGSSLSGLPSSYQEYMLSQQDPGFAAFNATQSTPMNSTIQNEILAADETIAASESTISALTQAKELNRVAYDGPWAGQRATGTALFGNAEGQATLELQNIVTSNALSSLKSIFGAAPTEGERKILLDIQGSVDQPRAVRDAIFDRAIAAAERRIALNQQKSQGLRSGQYFTPGYGQQPANTTSSGVSWRIEP